MADPFLAEIRIFGFNYPPTGWAFCDGQIMPISQNTALFSLLGTQFGGDGKSTFALPDLQGRVPVHQGQGQGLDEYFIGQEGGEQTVTLQQSEMPAHTHSMNALVEEANERQPPNQLIAIGSSIGMYDEAGNNPGVTIAPQSLAVAGSGLPHNNLMPYLTANFCIALQGIFPQRP